MVGDVVLNVLVRSPLLMARLCRIHVDVIFMYCLIPGSSEAVFQVCAGGLLECQVAVAARTGILRGNVANFGVSFSAANFWRISDSNRSMTTFSAPSTVREVSGASSRRVQICASQTVSFKS